MNILKKLGALAGASALAATGIVAVATTTASAQPVTAAFDQAYYTIGGTATLTVGGCAAGGVLEIAVPGEEEDRVINVVEPAEPTVIEITLPENTFGEMGAAARCTEPVEGGQPTVTTAEAQAYILNQTISANPSVFEAGEEISVTAGEFLAGETATMKVTPRGGGEVVYTHEMGTVAEDRGSVTAPVTFPADIECGLYDVTVSTVTNAATATLNICGQDDDDETPPTVTPTADPTVAPTQPTRPGLPKTGN
ncbi:hypothetical protein [Tessaracoccus massiliensis]|uniref:hypothetical protein n=1 Tax=Tessaracoccus massiliensis TaxID=1522311 RepID=UPI0005904A1D|nr:hypothetical protein [Tessaracoccus massiliensis]